MRRRLARAAAIGGLWVLVWCGRGPVMAVSAESPPALIQHDYEILEVYLDAEEALALMFPEATRFAARDVQLTPEQAARIGTLAGHPLEQARFTIHEAYRDGTRLGSALVTEEIGRFHDITFLVGATPEGRVHRVEVLVYRESRGGEVRHRRFLHQYEGKSLRDPIRLNRDIINITGATLSVHAMNRGVRKALGVLQAVYGAAGD